MKESQGPDLVSYHQVLKVVLNHNLIILAQLILFQTKVQKKQLPNQNKKLIKINRIKMKMGKGLG